MITTASNVTLYTALPTRALKGVSFVPQLHVVTPTVTSNTSGSRQSLRPISIFAIMLPNCVIVSPVNPARRSISRPL